MPMNKEYDSMKNFNKEAKDKFKSFSTPKVTDDDDLVFEKRLRFGGKR